MRDDHVHALGDDDGRRAQLPPPLTRDVRDARLGQSMFCLLSRVVRYGVLAYWISDQKPVGLTYGRLLSHDCLTVS